MAQVNDKELNSYDIYLQKYRCKYNIYIFFIKDMANP